MSLPPRILYVDDEPENCEMMRYWLRESCGMDVITATNGTNALEYIDKEFFDIFLLDYCLPDTTGIELCKKIRELNLKSPVIIYSALDRKIDRQRALAAGADLYLVKPDDFDLVKPQVERLLNQSVIKSSLRANEVSLQEQQNLTHKTIRSSRVRRRHSQIM